MPDPEVLKALEKLSKEDWDRLRNQLWKKYSEILKKIPEAKDPDDVLHDSIDKLLRGVRNCPLYRIALTQCLSNIVRSEVHNIWTKYITGKGKGGCPNEKEGGQDKEDNIIDIMTFEKTLSKISELHAEIISLFSKDSLSKAIMVLQLDHIEKSNLGHLKNIVDSDQLKYDQLKKTLVLKPMKIQEELSKKFKDLEIKDINNSFKRIKNKFEQYKYKREKE